MSERTRIIPQIPDTSNKIRTYSNDYPDTSDTESEEEPRFEADRENEAQQTTDERLAQNKDYMETQIAGWKVESQIWENQEFQLIVKPTASKLSHRLLNPFIYRNIKNVGTLNQLSILLDAPEDWETHYNQVRGNYVVNNQLEEFRNLADDTYEPRIQSMLNTIVSLIGGLLGVVVYARSEKKIIVGGILAKHEYDVRSRTDPYFKRADGVNLIASEVKTNNTFASDAMWYHDCRGIQVLTALYSFNCPTFLLNQKQWKLFVENEARNAIFTYPYNEGYTSHVNSSLVNPMGSEFIKAIVICLLSKRLSTAVEDSKNKAAQSSTATVTPQKKIIKPKFFDTPNNKPQPKRSRASNSKSKENSGKKAPCFISGYSDGQPIYSIVRVVPDTVVAEIEMEIVKQEQIELLKQKSDSTLY